MIYKTKEEHDEHILLMLKNTTCDEVAFNIDTKPSIPNYETAYTLLLEELTETEEALNMAKHNLQEFFTLIRMNSADEEIRKQVNLISFIALEVMQEAMHTRAVAIKTIMQLEKEKTPAYTTSYRRLKKYK